MTQLRSKGPEEEIPWKRGCLQHWPITKAINNLTDQSEFIVNTRSLRSTAVFRLGAQSNKGRWGLRRSFARAFAATPLSSSSDKTAMLRRLQYA